jgi:hypothetical protein
LHEEAAKREYEEKEARVRRLQQAIDAGVLDSLKKAISKDAAAANGTGILQEARTLRDRLEEIRRKEKSGNRTSLRKPSAEEESAQSAQAVLTRSLEKRLLDFCRRRKADFRCLGDSTKIIPYSHSSNKRALASITPEDLEVGDVAPLYDDEFAALLDIAMCSDNIPVEGEERLNDRPEEVPDSTGHYAGVNWLTSGTVVISSSGPGVIEGTGTSDTTTSDTTGTSGWTLNVYECPAGTRNAAASECLAAVQEAAQSAGLQVRSLIKNVDVGSEAGVPPGCSYSNASKLAIFNVNPEGRSLEYYQGKSNDHYPWACIDETKNASPEADTNNTGANVPALNFGSCAVVGSGAALKGRGLGPEIDAHDVVIVVNNMPAEDEHADLGSRMDIFYGTCVGVGRERGPDRVGRMVVTTGGHDPAVNPVCHTSSVGWNTSTFTAMCKDRFKAAIFRNVAMDSPGSPKAHYMSDYASYSDVALGWESMMVTKLVHYLRQEGKYEGITPAWYGKPSTGLHAVATMAMLCQSVALYGFTGSDNNDGHSEEGHNIEGEHRLLEGLANHSIRKEDFPSEEYFIAWEMTNISIVI